MANTELLEFYVKENFELKQAVKWLRIWMTSLHLYGIIYPNGPRTQRLNNKVARASSRLFYIIGE